MQITCFKLFLIFPKVYYFKHHKTHNEVTKFLNSVFDFFNNHIYDLWFLSACILYWHKFYCRRKYMVPLYIMKKMMKMIKLHVWRRKKMIRPFKLILYNILKHLNLSILNVVVILWQCISSINQKTLQVAHEGVSNCKYSY